MKQNCGTCPFQSKCWDKTPGSSTRPEALVLNLLVCRMKEGLHVDRTAKLILKMLRPKTVSIVQWIRERLPEVDADTLFLEAQSATIEALLYHYRIDKPAYPLHYLYNRQIGYMIGWAKKYINKHMRSTQHLVFVGASIPTDLEPVVEEEEEYTPSRAVAARNYAASSVIEDGVTLTTSEYRAVKFCLNYAGETTSQKAVVNGLHKKVAAYAGISRRQVSRHFEKAVQKIQEHVEGPPPNIPESVDLTTRKQRMLGLANGGQLSPVEIRDLAKHFDENGVSDTCRVFALNERAVYKYHREHHAKSATQRA